MSLLGMSIVIPSYNYERFVGQAIRVRWRRTTRTVRS